MKGAARWRFGARLAIVLLPGCAPLAETLVVPDDFSSIQAAIDEAEPNDVVLVEPGTYTGNPVLRSAVDVIGRATARTILEPDDDAVPTVTVNDVTGARFSNFTLRGGGVGVSVNRSSGIDIMNVVFERAADIGLAVDGSAVEAANNVFYLNDVAIRRANDEVEIVNNIFAGNGTAIATTGVLVDPFQNVRSNCFFDNDSSPSDNAGSAGAGATFGEPQFVDPDRLDFHLREGSACIDVGRGLDIIDASPADAGAYGGELADLFPFPVPRPMVEAVPGADPATAAMAVSWQANLSHRVTNSTNAGGYRVYYTRGALPQGPAPTDYDGSGAAGGASPIDVGNVTAYTLEGLDVEVSAPLAPRIGAVDGRNEAAVLEWEAVDGATSYRVHYGLQDVSENQVDVGDVTRHTVTGLTNGSTYRFAVSALSLATWHVAVSVLDNSQARHESVLSPPASLALGDAAESPLSEVVSTTPGPIDAYPPLPDEDACFIATAAFDSPHAAPVEVLRAFRDRFLMTHPPGRWLVRRYYASSPPLARFLNEHAALKPVVRAALLPLVGTALVMLEGGVGAGGAMLALAFAAVVLRRRRARGAARAAPGSAAGVVVVLAAVAVCAAAPANGQPLTATSSPRWMYEIKGGYFYPDLDDYETFYGDDRDTQFALAGAYRWNPWLETGVEIGYSRDRGAGSTSAGDPVADAVRQELLPVSLFADFIFERAEWHLVPYAGVGIGWTFYRQEVVLQPERDGRTDAGAFARAGLRWRFASSGEPAAGPRRGDTLFTRSYVFIEAQHSTAEIDSIDLGGTAYRVGVRFEFELAR